MILILIPLLVDEVPRGEIHPERPGAVPEEHRKGQKGGSAGQVHVVSGVPLGVGLTPTARGDAHFLDLGPLPVLDGRHAAVLGLGGPRLTDGQQATGRPPRAQRLRHLPRVSCGFEVEAKCVVVFQWTIAEAAEKQQTQVG